jgi:hypothetical protein
MLGAGLRYSGWLRGRAVADGKQLSWKCANVLETRQAAQTEAADAGPGCAVR